MKCSYCGAEYEGNFCPDCGARAETQSSETPPPIQHADTQHQNPIPPVGKNVASYQKANKPKKPVYKKWWFYAIIAVVLIAIIGVAAGGAGGSKKIDWSTIVLKDVIPEPPSTKGEINVNSAELLSVDLEKVADDQYNTYLNACIDMGFDIDAEKSSSSYEAYNSDGYSLRLSHPDDELDITVEAPMQMGTITWPTSTVGSQIPAPKSTIGKFEYENEDGFFVYVGETSKADYDQYVSDCSAKGFSVDYDKDERYYSADNEAGYHITLEYEGNNIMSVEISSPKEDVTTPEPTATEAPVTASPTEEAESVTPTATPEPTTNDTGNTDSNGIRSDFKAAMDSYESFINDYVDFYKKYEENPSDLSLLADYADYMTKLSDMTSKFDQWESEGLNDAELDYWLEVQTRVNAKLVEVAQ